MSEPEKTAGELVDAFEGKAPKPGEATDQDAASAYLAWLKHPYVCSGGELADQYGPAFLAGLLSGLLSDVERLARERDEALLQIYCIQEAEHIGLGCLVSELGECRKRYPHELTVGMRDASDRWEAARDEA